MEKSGPTSGLSLRKIFGLSSIYGITPILDRAMGLLLLPLYTHYLDTSQYGSMVLFYTFAFIVRLTAFMGFPDSLQKLVWDYKEQELKKFLGSVWLFNLAVNLAMLSALGILSRTISGFLLKNEGLSFLLVLVVVNVFLATQSIIPYVLFRAREQKGQILAYNLTSVLVRVGATVLFLVVMKMGLVGIFLADIAASLAVLAFCLPAVLKSIRIHFDFSFIRVIFRLSAFQLAIELFAWVLSLSDRVLIQRLLHSTAEVGVYAVGYTFGMAALFLINPVLAAWRPHMFAVNAGSRRDYVCQMGDFFPIFAIGCGAALLMLLTVSPDLIRILTPAPYHRAGSLVLILLAGQICAAMSNYFLPTFFLERRLQLVSLAYAAASAANIAANFLLLPRIGIAGAAWATLAGYALLLGLIIAFSQRLVPLNLSFKKIGVIAASLAAAAWIITSVGAARPLLSLALKGAVLVPILAGTACYIYVSRRKLLYRT